MRHRLEVFALLVALFILLPTATANEDVHGLLTTQGELVLSGPTNGTLPNVMGLLIPDLTQGIALTLNAPYGRACLQTKQFARTEPLPVVGGTRTEVP